MATKSERRRGMLRDRSCFIMSRFVLYYERWITSSYGSRNSCDDSGADLLTQSKAFKMRAAKIVELLGICLIALAFTSGEAFAQVAKKIYFAALYEKIFQKIYLSTIFESPQGMPPPTGWCTDQIEHDRYRLRESMPSDLRAQMPISYIDERTRYSIQKFKYWPFLCSPIGVAKLEFSQNGFGQLAYIKVEFLKLSRCEQFIDKIHSAIGARSLEPYYMNDVELQGAKNFFGIVSPILDLEHIRNKDHVEREVSYAMEAIDKLKIFDNCRNGTLEFK